MSGDGWRNADLAGRLAGLAASRSSSWLTSEQPVSWHPRTWQKRWQEQSLPCPHVLDELREEQTSHGTIRRSFVFSYQDRSPAEFFIAVMAWGLGPGHRQPGPRQGRADPAVPRRRAGYR
jgi:hypothetical protein